MGRLSEAVGTVLGPVCRGRGEDSLGESTETGDARGVESESECVFLLDRLLVSIICGANFRGREVWALEVAKVSIGCGNARAAVDVTSTGSRDVSLILFTLADPFLEALDQLSTGCGSGRRGFVGVVGLLGAPEEPLSWDAAIE